MRRTLAVFPISVALATIALDLSPTPSLATTHTWTGAVSGQWSLPGNWVGLTPPPNNGTGLCVLPQTSGSHSVSISPAWTILGLNLVSSVPYSLSGPVTLGFSSGPAAFGAGILMEDPASLSSANHTISGPLVVLVDQTWRNRTAATLTFQSGVSLNGRTLTLEGGPEGGNFVFNGFSSAGHLVYRNLNQVTLGQGDGGVSGSNTIEGNTRVVCTAESAMPFGSMYLREGSIDVGSEFNAIGDGDPHMPSLVLGNVIGCASTGPRQRVIGTPSNPVFLLGPLDGGNDPNLIEYRMPTVGYASIEGGIEIVPGRTIYVEEGPDPVNDLVISAVISNSGVMPGVTPAFRKTGAGELRLQGANAFNLRVEVAEGRLTLEHNSALGASGDTNRTIVLPGATVEVAPGLDIPETIHLGAAGASAAGTVRAGTSTWSGPIRQRGNATLQAFGTGPFTILGTISTMGSGLLTIDGPGEVSFSGTVHLGLDSVAVAAGALRLATAATIAETEVRTGATLLGDGATSGRVLVRTGGRAEPGHGILPGTYGIFEAANLVLEPGSVTSFAVGGTAPGVTYDRAAITASATLAGTLDFRQGGAFTPVVGDSFVVLTYGSRTGTFEGLTSNVPLPPNAQWSLVYGANALTARVVATVAVEPHEAPRSSVLLLPVPNPLRASTTLSFDLARAGRVDLEAFDASGRRVASLLSKASYPAGRHAFAWSGRDVTGRMVSQGVYFLQLSVDGARVGESRKLVVSP